MADGQQRYLGEECSVKLDHRIPWYPELELELLSCFPVLPSSRWWFQKKSSKFKKRIVLKKI